jgi:hypothetical protein
MGSMGLYANATEAVGMGTSAIYMAIRKDECIKKIYSFEQRP